MYTCIPVHAHSNTISWTEEKRKKSKKSTRQHHLVNRRKNKKEKEKEKKRKYSDVCYFVGESEFIFCCSGREVQV